MAAIFITKRGDTSPALLYRLPVGNCYPVFNFMGATVVFNMRLGDTVVINRAAANFEDDRTLLYEWNDQDVAQEGRFEAEFEVTYSDGTVETFPKDGFIVVLIGEDIR